MIYKTDKELQKACEKWQKIMRLQDWKVVATITRERHMNMQEVEAECLWTIQNRSAMIHILDPIDRPDDSWFEQDMEESLVHELMHLSCAMFDDFETDTKENTALEQMIVSTSQALVNLKRK